jgi:hypothetical protein
VWEDERLVTAVMGEFKMPVVSDFAFPFEHEQKFSVNHPLISNQGLSKREYFAAAVLQAVFSNPQVNLYELSDDQRQYLVSMATFVADEAVQSLSGDSLYAEEEDYPEEDSQEEYAEEDVEEEELE